MEDKIVQKERRVKMLSLVALIVAVLGLIVAFAAMSRTLTINGTANVNASDWDIHIENVSTTITGDVKEKAAPTISETSITGINVLPTKSGDSVVYGFDVVNEGTIDAKYTGGLTAGYTNEQRDNMTEEELMTHARKIYTECDWNGDGTTADEELPYCVQYIYFVYNQKGNVSFEEGYITSDHELPVGKKHRYEFAVSFEDFATELTKGNIVVDINKALIYEQN